MSFLVHGLAAVVYSFMDGEFEAPSCTAEAVMRQMLKKPVNSPNVLRGIFHDAVDMDNLLLKNQTSGIWYPVSGSYGGVDGCLYSPLTHGTHGHPSPSHNRNIMDGFKWAQQLCEDICANAWPAGLAGEPLCWSRNNCEVDVTVLGSLVAIENFGGPPIDMVWGRKKGDCAEGNIVSPFTKEIDSKTEYSLHPALNMAPSLTGIDDPDQFRSVFAHLGFTPTDQVALMGAHSVGQLQVCAGGLNGIEHGPFCPLSGKASGFGDGGLWDRTPLKFDNDYFLLFANDSFEGKDTCCGKLMSDGKCHRSRGNMVRIMRNDDGGIIGKEEVKDQACGVSWCRSDRKDRTHMKSTKESTMVDESWPGFRKSKKHGLRKRMIRLAGDWALLAHTETKSKVQTFAQDESAFFMAFATAWAKVIRKTHRPLSACSGKADEADVREAHGYFVCQDTHKLCPKIADKACRKERWKKRCPRKCGLCAGSDVHV